MTRRIRQTTTTTLVLDALRRADDFMTALQLRDATGRNTSQVGAALHVMRKVRAVDCLASGGTLWWYALPPEEDKRTRIVEERVPESKPRSKRKPRVKVTDGPRN